MTLKLTPQQAQALYQLFDEMVLCNLPSGLDQQLISLHMVSVFYKLRSKWEGEHRKVYSLKLTPAEALAYRIYWRDNNVSDYPYEWSMIVTQCQQIDKELTSKQNRIISNTQKFLNQ